MPTADRRRRGRSRASPLRPFPAAPIADVVKETKRASSVWLKQKAPDLAEFAWQAGSGAFSIGFSQVDAVIAYIAGQEEHHRKISFQDEFRELLRRYEIEYDDVMFGIERPSIQPSSGLMMRPMTQGSARASRNPGLDDGTPSA